MALISTLVDSFNDNIIGPEWGNSYGGASETGGRARVPCVAATYAGYQTGRAWTLAGSSVYLQLPLVAAAAGASTGANTVFSVICGTAGTNLAFNINTVGTTMRLESNVAYFDAGATSLTYSAVTHLWLRFREDGTNVYWETSTDGSAWTIRRTLATPAWIDTAIDDCALDLWCTRDAGTTNYAEFDNVNTTVSGGTVYFASAALTADGAQSAAAVASAVISADLTADSDLTAATQLAAHASADLMAESDLTAGTDADDTSDADIRIGTPCGRWAVSTPWI